MSCHAHDITSFLHYGPPWYYAHRQCLYIGHCHVCSPHSTTHESQQWICIAVNALILSCIHYTILKHVAQSLTAATNNFKYVSHSTLMFTHHHLQSFKMKASFKKDISTSTYCSTLNERPTYVAYTCLYNVIILWQLSVATSCWLAHHIITQYIMKNKATQYIRKSKGNRARF